MDRLAGDRSTGNFFGTDRTDRPRRVVQLAAALGAAVLLAAAPAAAEPILSIEFDSPSGTAAVDESIDIDVTVEVEPGSDTLVFSTDGLFTAGGTDYKLSGVINRGDFFPDYDLALFDFDPAFDGLTLMPGDIVSFVFATLAPPPGGAVPGVYTLGSAQLRLLLADLTFVEDIPAPGSFVRTVPEPGTAAAGGTALAALVVLAAGARRHGS